MCQIVEDRLSDLGHAGPGQQTQAHRAELERREVALARRVLPDVMGVHQRLQPSMRGTKRQGKLLGNRTDLQSAVVIDEQFKNSQPRSTDETLRFAMATIPKHKAKDLKTKLESVSIYAGFQTGNTFQQPDSRFSAPCRN